MKQNPMKHILHMYSIQHKPENVDKLTEKEKLHIYCNFRNRVKEKNSDKYVDKGTKPCMLRVLRQGSLFDAEVTYLVVIGSFKVTYSSTDPKDEIGFTAEMRTHDGNYYRLTVLMKQFTAVLVQILDV